MLHDCNSHNHTKTDLKRLRQLDSSRLRLVRYLQKYLCALPVYLMTVFPM